MSEKSSNNKLWAGLFGGLFAGLAVGLILLVIIVLAIFNLVGFFLGRPNVSEVGNLKCDQNYQIQLQKEEKFIPIVGLRNTSNLYLVKGSEKKEIMKNKTEVPQIPKLYQEFEEKYFIKNIHDEQEEYTPGNIESREISSTEISQAEFEIIGNCLVKDQGKGNLGNLPNKILFPKNTTSKAISTSLTCPDKSTIEILLDGNLNFKYFPTKNYIFNLGKFHRSNDFSRFSGKIVDFSAIKEKIPEYLQKEYDPEKHLPVEIKIDFLGNKSTESYIDEQIWPKELANGLFSETGTKDDYLQTCKNSEGKTIFNIFKD